jgi:plastocyanin
MALRRKSIALMLLATLALACGGEGATAVGSQTAVSEEDSATTAGAVTAGPTMTIEGRVFGPAPEVAAGESFTIINLDSTRHTFSSSDGSWEQVDLAPDSQVSFTVPEGLAPGKHVFFCAIHSSMGGTLTVTS